MAIHLLHRAGGRAAHREAGRSAVRRARGLRAAAGDRRRAARSVAHPGRPPRAAHARRVDVEALVRKALEAQRARRGRSAASSCAARCCPARARCASDRRAHRARLREPARQRDPPQPARRRGARARDAATTARVRFEVVDRGPGVPREHRQAIFEKFFRVPGAPPGGAGLGPLHRARDRAARTAARSASRASPGSGSALLVHAAARAAGLISVLVASCACARASTRRCRGCARPLPAAARARERPARCARARSRRA